MINTIAKKTVSIVVSVFNEEQMIGSFYNEIKACCESLSKFYEFEFLFVNDGSTDNSFEVLKKISILDSRVKIIRFSRNFGHEAAMISGIDYSKGNAVICMDADLQHPPSLIKDMLDAFENGSDVVNMVRKSREDKGIFRSLFNYLFYRTLNKLSNQKIEPNATDFFLISKRVAFIVKSYYRNNNRFIRAVIQNIGFNQTSIDFHAPGRAAGESKYSLFKLIKLALTAFTSHTLAPLKAGIFLGLIFSIQSLILLFYSLFMWFYERPTDGYTTLISFLSFAFAILFILIGIIGDYLGKVFIETKNIPIYVVQDMVVEGKVINNHHFEK